MKLSSQADAGTNWSNFVESTSIETIQQLATGINYEGYSIVVDDEMAQDIQKRALGLKNQPVVVEKFSEYLTEVVQCAVGMRCFHLFFEEQSSREKNGW